MKGCSAALLRLFVLGLLALCCAGARADTPVSLFQAFRGQVNFVGTEETLRTKSNYQPCRLVGAGSAIYAYLGGIPSGAKVLSAQLYWAGSGRTPDYSVNFDGVPATAPANRRYTSATIGGGYYYFSGAADVTSQVAAKGNGYYTFSGLSVDNGDPWCSAQGVVGGFSLLVVYSSTSEAYRLLNVYEGFQYFRNSGFTLTLNNFAIPNPLPTNITGRVAHITWEGDGTLSGGGEDLLFNGYEMTDSINPSGNQFNSASNVTGDTTSYGIDFDAYTVRYPVIKPGQTTATTTYRSGQDMVLLSAEVAALPYIPLADLSLSMTRSGALQVGSTATYTLSVTNNGADTETGPVTVVDTLPAGLTLSSAKGSGWSCTSKIDGNSQTIVTCVANGPVLSGATMNPLAIAVSPTRAGNYTNSATVTGQTGDTNQGNNTASDSGSASDPNQTPAKVPFVFTTRACNPNESIQTPTHPGCPLFHGPVTADTLSSGLIFITSLDVNTGKLTVPSPATVSVQLAMNCVPMSAQSASYAGAKLDCKGTPQTVQLQFNATPDTASSAVLQSRPGDPNSAATFAYPDVGNLTLNLSYGGASLSQPIVSQPAYIVLTKAFRASDQVLDRHDPIDTDPNSPKNQPDVAFAKAGENVVLQVGAAVGNPPAGTAVLLAPSFGCETTPPAVTLTVNSPAGKQDTLDYSANFAPTGGAGCSGLLQGAARWYEAGLLNLTPSLADYLGSGAVGGAARLIGRFYPDHFSTGYFAPFQCLPGMACPAQVPDGANIVYGVSGAAYSGEPVNVQVVAYGLKPGGGYQQLNLYSPAQKLILSAVDQPNGAVLASGGTFPDVTAQVTPDYDGNGLLTDYKLGGAVKYQLAFPYDPNSPHAGNWSKPQAVYLRASTQDQIMVAGQGSPQALTITSQLTPPPTAPLPPQQEDGIMLVAGRLFVGNVFGSELAQVPLPLTAQYWTGTAWRTNTNDSASVVATSLKFANCTRSFVNNCQLSALPPTAVPTGGGAGLQLANGAGRLILKAPPRGQNGSIDIGVVNDPAANPDAATWLPSTTGRASFGLFKNTLIYLREVY